MHTIIYIFSIYYYNAIYEHMHHTHSFQNRLLFIDGVVVIHAKITFYCFNDMHIGCPDKGTSVNSLAPPPPPAAMFANADDHLSNCVKNPSQYN